MEMSSQDVTVVIPQRRRADLTRRCVATMRRWEGTWLAVIVVDDGSDDDSAEQIRRAGFPNCRVVTQPPRGVTAAWNTGIQHARTSFVVLLNNDVEIRGTFVERLVGPLRNHRALIVGAEWRHEPHLPPQIRTSLKQARMLAGWCLAFRRDLWQRLAGFDESLAMYFSDTDFQCRAAIDSSSIQPTGSRCVLHSAGPLPLRHLGHQTTQSDPQRNLQWRLDRAAFLQAWAEGHGCSKSATSDELSAEPGPAPGR